MVDIGESFKSSVPKSRIDGKVGRQLYQTLPLVKANYSQYKKSSDQVVLELGYKWRLYCQTARRFT